MKTEEAHAQAHDPEMWAEVKKSEHLVQLVSDLAKAPAIAKLVDMFAARQNAQSRVETRVRVAALKVQSKNILRGNIFVCVALTLCLIFLGVVIYWLKADKDTLLPVLSALIGLIAGAGGGYVFGRQTAGTRSE